MKRNLILSMLACGASALLAGPALAETSGVPATATPTSSAEPKACHEGWHHHGGGPGEHLAMLTAALKLDATQQAEIKTILEAAHTQVKATWENTSLSKEEKIAKVKETMQGAFGQIKGDLNSTQVAQLEAIQTAMHQRWHHKGQGGAAPGSTASPATSPASNS